MDSNDVILISAGVANALRRCGDFEAAMSSSYEVIGVTVPNDNTDPMPVRIVRLVELAGDKRAALIAHLNDVSGSGMLNRPAGSGSSVAAADPEAVRLAAVANDERDGGEDLFDDMPVYQIAKREAELFYSPPGSLPGKVRIVLDYPLDNPVLFEVELDTEAWSYADICKAIADKYLEIYENAEHHGVWGHDIGDLVIEGLVYFPSERLIYPEVGS